MVNGWVMDEGYEFVEAPNVARDRDLIFWVLTALVLVLLVALTVRPA